MPPLVHVVPLNRLTALIGAPRRVDGKPPAGRLANEVDRWLRILPWPWRKTCLKRAAILYGLLRPANSAIELHVGVKRDGEAAFAAHAWLVRNGVPYLEPPESPIESYQVIAKFPDDGVSLT
jgi:hypothetical protein